MKTDCVMVKVLGKAIIAKVIAFGGDEIECMYKNKKLVVKSADVIKRYINRKDALKYFWVEANNRGWDDFVAHAHALSQGFDSPHIRTYCASDLQKLLKSVGVEANVMEDSYAYKILKMIDGKMTWDTVQKIAYKHLNKKDDLENNEGVDTFYKLTTAKKHVLVGIIQAMLAKNEKIEEDF